MEFCRSQGHTTHLIHYPKETRAQANLSAHQKIKEACSLKPGKDLRRMGGEEESFGTFLGNENNQVPLAHHIRPKSQKVLQILGHESQKFCKLAIPNL